MSKKERIKRAVMAYRLMVLVGSSGSPGWNLKMHRHYQELWRKYRGLSNG